MIYVLLSPAPNPLSCFPSLVDLFVFPRSVPTVVIFTKGTVIADCHYHQFSFSSPVYPWMWRAIKRSSEAVGRAGLLMVKRVMQSFICHPVSSVYCRWVSYGDVALPAIFRRKKEVWCLQQKNKIWVYLEIDFHVLVFSRLFLNWTLLSRCAAFLFWPRLFLKRT